MFTEGSGPTKGKKADMEFGKVLHQQLNMKELGTRASKMDTASKPMLTGVSVFLFVL